MVYCPLPFQTSLTNEDSKPRRDEDQISKSATSRAMTQGGGIATSKAKRKLPPSVDVFSSKRGGNDTSLLPDNSESTQRFSLASRLRSKTSKDANAKPPVPPSRYVWQGTSTRLLSSQKAPPSLPQINRAFHPNLKNTYSSTSSGSDTETHKGRLRPRK